MKMFVWYERSVRTVLHPLFHTLVSIDLLIDKQALNRNKVLEANSLRGSDIIDVSVRRQFEGKIFNFRFCQYATLLVFFLVFAIVHLWRQLCRNQQEKKDAVGRTDTKTVSKKCQSLPVNHFNTPLVTHLLTTCNPHF